MSNPTTSNKAEIAELVTKHINNLDDKGKLQLPEDMPDWHKHIIRSEKRQRDAQAELGKTQATLRGVEASNEVLRKQALSIVPGSLNLGEAELQALEVLKTNDVEAYRLQVNELEALALKQNADALAALTSEAVTKANETFIAKDRITVLHEFRSANPNTVLTDEVLVNDVPPRFMNELNAGKYDYSTYLVKVSEYLQTAKVVPNVGTGEEHSLSGMAGGKTPGKAAADEAGKSDYNKITF